MCSLLSLVMYPKRVHFTSLTLATEYWGPDGTCPKQGHNHNLDSITLNYS
jgi:hypothetical protein